MAYMVAVVRASEDYTGTAWVRYDAAYRRQAAVSGNRTWSRINPSLYALCFTGKAQAAKRCDLCLSVSHESKECSILTETDPDLPSRLKAVESAVVAFAQGPLSGPDKRGGGSGAKYQDTVCRSWNEKRCYFRRCRYRHVCATCGGPHPAADCYQGNRSAAGPIKQQPAVGDRPKPY